MVDVGNVDPGILSDVCCSRLLLHFSLREEVLISMALRLMERAQLGLAHALFLPALFVPGELLRRTLHPPKIGSLIPVVALLPSSVAQDMDEFAVYRLHDYATANDGLRASGYGEAGKVVYVHVAPRRSDAVKIECAVTGALVPQVLVADSVQDDVFETVVSDMSLCFRQTVLPVIHLVNEVLRLLPRTYRARGHLLIEPPPHLRCDGVVSCFEGQLRSLANIKPFPQAVFIWLERAASGPYSGEEDDEEFLVGAVKRRNFPVMFAPSPVATGSVRVDALSSN